MAARQKLRADASRKQKTLDPRSLVAVEFIILGTSLPTEGYPDDVAPGLGPWSALGGVDVGSILLTA